MKDINLLPEEIKSTSTYVPTKSKAGISLKGITIAVLVLLIFGVTLIAPQVYIKTLEMQLQTLENEIKSEKYNEVKRVNAELATVDGVLSAKSDVMDSIDSSNYPINEIIIAINSVVPEGCVINSIKYAGKGLSISGQADNNIVVAELISRISRLNFLNIVQDVNFVPGGSFEIKLITGAEGSGAK